MSRQPTIQWTMNMIPAWIKCMKKLHGQVERYLRIINDPDEDECFICQRLPDELRQKQPDIQTEEISTHVRLMTYKFKYPICCHCYSGIQGDSEFIDEVQKSDFEKIWIY